MICELRLLESCSHLKSFRSFLARDGSREINSRFRTVIASSRERNGCTSAIHHVASMTNVILRLRLKPWKRRRSAGNRKVFTLLLTCYEFRTLAENSQLQCEWLFRV